MVKSSFGYWRLDPLHFWIVIKNGLRKYLEGELLVMFHKTFLIQVFSQLCFCLQDFIKIANLLFATVSIKGLISYLPNKYRLRCINDGSYKPNMLDPVFIMYLLIVLFSYGTQQYYLMADIISITQTLPIYCPQPMMQPSIYEILTTVMTYWSINDDFTDWKPGIVNSEH